MNPLYNEKDHKGTYVKHSESSKELSQELKQKCLLSEVTKPIPLGHCPEKIVEYF